MKKVFALVFALFLSVQGGAFAESIKTTCWFPEVNQKLEDVAPYPQAPKDMVRHAIYLEEKENEGDYRLEIIIGKTLTVDCNQSWFAGGNLTEKTLEGWGYSYYELSEVGPQVQTLIGCPAGSEKEGFVPVNMGDSAFIRYNSKLPVVIYAPKGFEVKYRIWHAEAVSNEAIEK